MTNKILDVGCGEKKLLRSSMFSGYNFQGEITGLDINKTKATDIIWNLETGKLPFKNKEFDIIYTSHCLEHIQNLLPLMYELNRVLKPNGFLLITVPHLSYLESMNDLTHRRLFGYHSFDFLTTRYHQQITSPVIFRMIKRKIVFPKIFKLMGVEFLANKYPEVYSNFLTGMFQAREITFEMQKINK